VKLPQIKWRAASAAERIPRGAIAVVVVGVIATIAAALLSGNGGGGSAAHLEWVVQKKLPDSAKVEVPGNPGTKMQLTDAKLQSTGTNDAGYALFRTLATARIEKGVKLEEGSKLLCSIHTGVLIAQSAGEGELRMLYPRSSETGIYGQPVGEEVVAQFASHGHLSAVLVINEDLHARYTTVKGVKLEWPEYELGTENLEYLLPRGTPKAAIALPFYAIWKSTRRPSAQISCELKSPAGKATVETGGHMAGTAPPINEEAEEENEEQREEEGEGLEEKESEEGD
jgi:hypothetical protein